MYRAIPVIALSLSLAACGGGSSPTNPSSTDPPGTFQGQTVNAIDGRASASVTVRIGSSRPVTTDPSGYFSVDVGGPGIYPADLRNGSFVERETTVSPSGERVRMSLIPMTFDLGAFDEMFRTTNSRLQRWTTKPSLVVLATVMNFKSTADDEFQATSEQMTDDEVSLMLAHLNEGLALLTGNVFTSYESIEIERPSAGQRVSVIRTGKIVVGRYTGIVTLANTIGYGRWLEQPDGTINGGATFLDRDFDRGDARRRLLRIHELGHALGYQHVKSRTSIMNPAVGPEPTDFDRAGAIVAFQRPPGNRTPDIDPTSAVRLAAVSQGGGRWSAPTVCR